MKVTNVVLAAAMLTLTTQPACAEPNGKEFIAMLKADRATVDTAQIFLHGLSTAFGWTNTDLKMRGEKMLYCEPSDHAMSVDESVGIFRNFVLKDPKSDDLPAGFIMLQALKERFPCE